jgi:serine/threonine-protein kinase
MTADPASGTLSVSPELLALQRVVAGRYSIVRELGRGGMGVVFLARDVALERPVAIKLLPLEMAALTEHRDRFVREARTAAALAHPHIVPIHAVEDRDGVVFFVMAFVDGETLAERVARTGPLSSAEAMRVVQEVAWALAHAHARGVVHRDVKPENILLERGTGRALVTDFGIAWVGDGTHTSGAGKIVGTPRYMSPEQASGEPVTGRSDVYSLGAVAFFATTGRSPIDGTSAAAILTRKVMETAPSLSTLRKDLPARLVTAVDRSLARDPSMRWTSAEELATALRSFGGSDAEIPPVVRAYLRDADSVQSELGTALVVGVTSALMLGIVLASMTNSGFAAGIARAIAFSLYGGITSAMAGLALWRGWTLVNRSRRLLGDGYTHAAVASALAARDADQADDGDRASKGSVALSVLAGTAATAAAVALLDADSTVAVTAGVALSIVAPAATIRRLMRATGIAGDWWSRLMRGRIGRAVFRLAGIGAPRTLGAIPMTGEPTSIALGNAAGALFEALPADQRRRFAELPDVIQKLERAALDARRLAPSVEREERLAATVAALETIRLDLLRLHVDRAAAGDLTRDLNAAAHIGDQISEQIALRAPDQVTLSS